MNKKQGKENVIVSMKRLIDMQSIKESSKRQYRYNVEGFEKFLKEKSSSIFGWEDITLSLLNEYRNWLSNKRDIHPITKESVRMEDNTVNDKITKIYTIITYADRAEKIDIQAKRLDKIKKTNTNRDRVEENKVYIEDSELNVLWSLKLSDTEEKARDLFIFQSLTGQRFSDINGITISNINGDVVEVIQKKTKHKVSLPLADKRVKEIVSKYNGKLPKLTDAAANKALKEISKKANLNREMECVEMRGGEQYRYTAKMWQLVSTHTARRSFISNGLKMGIDSHTLRGITGHNTDDAFSRYNRMSSKDAANVYINQNNTASKQTNPNHSHICLEDYNKQMEELFSLKNQVEMLLNRAKKLSDINDVMADDEYYDRVAEISLFNDMENVRRDFEEEGI
ncbi:MAG: tyrosine-type recombinase/integrase [Muribaculum sp.]|nr:tyrosine-type recombinase/integrase [Muribaculum sp.]